MHLDLRLRISQVLDVAEVDKVVRIDCQDHASHSKRDELSNFEALRHVLTLVHRLPSHCIDSGDHTVALCAHC